jgi:hypothetical protein
MPSHVAAIPESIEPHPETDSGARNQSCVELVRFGVRPDSGQDATPGLRAAIEECQLSGSSKLVLAPGRYDFYPDRAFEKYLFISNNDEGLKRVGFPIMDVKDLEIDGRGAAFVFHGPMIPFLIEGSSGVTVRNLSFDFVRPFHSEARVLAITPSSVDLEFTDEFHYEIRNGILVFTNGQESTGRETTVTSGEVIYPCTNLLAYDADRRETAFMAKDHYALDQGLVAEEIGPRRVRLKLDGVSAQPGDTLVFGAPRKSPGIVISDSAHVRVENVAIHHCGGMGVIAQRSRNIHLSRVLVTPPPGGKRVVSVTADATHFVNCTGKIEMVDCVFETQKDDATNVHGLYAKITRILAPNRFEIRLIHPQQAGVDFVKPGMRLEITDGPSLEAKGIIITKSVERLNKEYTIVEIANPLDVVVGDVVSDADANNAEVLIKDCVIRGNRARGILLGSRGRMVIEGNTFHTPGSAILFEGDASHWFEQAGVRDVLIRGNTFDNCNFGVWGKACIEVGSGIADEHKTTSRYNKNIRIEDNLFRVFGNHPLVQVYSVDGLTFRGNRLERTGEYPAEKESAGTIFAITDSDNISTNAPELYQ